MAHNINNFYTENGILRAVKATCGTGKYEHNAVLNLW